MNIEKVDTELFKAVFEYEKIGLVALM